MNSTFDNGIVQLWHGSARDLSFIPDGSVDCCVTSPPYWGLRDYGLEPEIWDDGWSGTLGLEPTPELYTQHLVQIFAEVWRVLKPSGTVFLNLGDSYFGGGGAHKPEHANPGLSRSAQRGGVPHGGQSGTDGKGQSGLIDGAYASGSLCGECVVVLSYRNLDTYGYPSPKLDSLISESIHSRKEQPIDHSGSLHSASQGDQNATGLSGPQPSLGHAGEPPHASQESMQPLSSEQSQGECLHCASCDACLDVISSAKPYALSCARTGGRLHKSGSYTLWSVPRNDNKDASDLAYLDYTTASLKPKDLVGIPWRCAFALQAAGWWLRSDIIWAKPNPMPESVTDRPTKAHEYVFLLTKAEHYYYDQEAIRESAQDWGTRERVVGEHFTNGVMPNGQPHKGLRDGNNATTGRNKRSVWTIATHPYPEAHFATFPEALVEPCILAGTSEMGVCSQCGKPWIRQLEPDEERKAQLGKGYHDHSNDLDQGMSQDKKMPQPKGGYITKAWMPTCSCDAPTQPATVLDPFSGSGTTAMVAQKLGRRAIGVDASLEYLKLAEKRVSAVSLPMMLTPARSDADAR